MSVPRRSADDTHLAGLEELASILTVYRADVSAAAGSCCLYGQDLGEFLPFLL